MSEEQKQASAAVENAYSKESGSPKSKRGGKRPGAGRKPNLTKILLKGVSREAILAACENVDVGAAIIGLLRSKTEQSRIEALHFIFDRVTEFRMYRRDKDGKIVKERDHLLDAMRYLVMSGRDRMTRQRVAPEPQLIYSYPSENALRWMQ